MTSWNVMDFGEVVGHILDIMNEMQLITVVPLSLSWMYVT
jgi:hypothetical protein